MQPASPVVVVLRIDLPVLSNDFVGRAFRPVAQRGDHFVGGSAAVERCDQRLNDRRGAVVAAHIAPLFEEVRFRNLPMTQRRRLIVVQPESNAQLHFVERRREVEVGRGREHRVARHDDQQVDLAGVHVGDEVTNRCELIDRFGLNRLRMENRGADVAECLIDRVRERVDLGRLMIAGEDDAPAAMRLEILGDGVQELVGSRRSRPSPEHQVRRRAPEQTPRSGLAKAAAGGPLSRRLASASSRRRRSGSSARRLPAAAVRRSRARSEAIPDPTRGNRSRATPRCRLSRSRSACRRIDRTPAWRRYAHRRGWPDPIDAISLTESA